MPVGPFNAEAGRQCREIRLRAKRKAGKLLKKKDRPTRGNEGSAAAPSPLDDLRITKKQSTQWQQLADVPDDEFEAALSGPEKPTTNGVHRRRVPTKTNAGQ